MFSGLWDPLVQTNRRRSCYFYKRIITYLKQFEFGKVFNCKIMLGMKRWFYQEGMGHWNVNYIGTQSFINTLSHFLAYKVIGLFKKSWLIGWYKLDIRNQVFKGIRKFPIKWCKDLSMIHKIILSVDYDFWVEIL